ncbi:MAG: lipoate--protein ligase family protein [Anaerolineaceae bacterium]|nr:MAG: lipoate--protein ligase family protein [Anaerolineaceae bacterium]
MRQYRLITDQPTTGRRNMAIDEAIMNAVIAGSSPPTIRFYAWSPACLSLGYGQRAADADIERLQKRGWDVVRRATGGRAILHAHEMTYSVTVPDSHPLAEGGIIESYRRISEALRRGLVALGLRTGAERKKERLRDTGPVCFEVPSHYEITIGDGRKLIGSAQLRRRGGLLQHGTLPLHGDVTDICDGLQFASAAARDMAKLSVRQRAATLQDALGVIVRWEDAVTAMTDAFAEIFDADLTPADLSGAELAEAETLAMQVYGAESWTFRR